MKNRITKHWKNLLLTAFVLSVMVVNDSQAETLFGRVVGISDGDTLTVLDGENKQHVIRLFAIDAPETSCHSKNESVKDELCVEHGQPFGKASKKSLSNLVFGKEVNVEIQPGDSYGREIGTVWAANINANLEQVRRGYAWMYRQYAKRGLLPEEYREMEEAEQKAKENNLGLWSEGRAVPPWDYRHNGGGYHGK
jgi:endonuclease YncB( thermonuclease family)